MKILIQFSLSFCALVLFANCNFQEAEQSNEKRPNDWLYRQRANVTGEIDKQAYLNALTWRKEKLAERQLEKRSDVSWKLAGPTNVGGRITDVEMLSDNMESIFVGAASGGVFRSDNLGEDWSPIFDEAGSLSIGDMAFAPSNEQILYVGTGEANAGGNSLAFDGVGMYRSSDQGGTWEHLGLERAGSIGKVVVAADDPERVYVAAMGALFANNDERGVYRSIDGGTNWEQVLFVSDSTGAIDLAIHPNDPNILYAAMWERIRRPDRRAYGGATSGIYRSTDGGDTWDELTNGLPDTATRKGRIGIAIAASAPNILYAMYVHGTRGDLEGVYRSDDGGDSWQSMNTSTINSPPYMWWFGKIFVNPTDAENVFLTGFDMYESTNGGSAWNLTGRNMHVDQHSVFVHPKDPSLRLFANDGGVYLNKKGEAQARHLLNIPITQFYACAIDYQRPERLYGGTQDNNTVRTLTGNLDDWEFMLGGDGFTPLIDPTDSDVIYAQWQYGNLYRSTDGGLNFQSITNGIPASSRRNWNMPTLFDPTNSNTLYIGAERVYKSTNRGSSWQSISPDLTNGASTGNLLFGTLTSLSVSALNTNIIYAGADDGNVQVTTDAGNTWEKISETLPNRWVTSVFASPLEEGTAYVTFSGYRYGTNKGHVFRTRDFGASWEDVSNNLPDIPVNDILQNPVSGLLYLATDIGVFVADEEEMTWELFGEDLPLVVVTDVKLHEPTQFLVAATYGRSLYKVELPEITSAVRETLDVAVAVKAYPNPFQEQLQLSLNLEKPMPLQLALYDIQGRKIQHIFNGNLPKGKRIFEVVANELPSGTYFCKIQNKEQVRILKVVKQ